MRPWIEECGNEKPASKYVFEEFPFGFRVSAPDRVAVYVEKFDYGFRVYKDLERLTPVETFGFYAFPEMMERMSSILMSEWTRPLRQSKENITSHVLNLGDVPGFDVDDWAKKQTRIAIAARVKVQWRRLLSTADPLVVEAQKKVFAATHKPTPWPMLIREFYEDRYVVSDIIKFKGAAVALYLLDDLTHEDRLLKVETDPAFVKVAETMKSLGVEVSLRGSISDRDGMRMSISRVLAYMRNWKCLFSDDGSPYRALNITLQNLPGNVPIGFLMNLRNGRLLQPITERSPLILACAYLGRKNGFMYAFGDNVDWDRMDRIFLMASSGEVKRALAMVGRASHDDLTSRKSAHIYNLVTYLMDTPNNSSVKLLGLTKSAIRYHRHLIEEARNREEKLVNLEARTAAPPVGLPPVEGVRFLGSVKEIFIESAEMNHCVYSYAYPAVAGEHYLFHIERNGMSATMQVSPSGDILQCLGPRNRTNYATGWARKVVRPWLSDLRKAFRSGATPVVYPDVYYKEYAGSEGDYAGNNPF